MLSGDQPQRSHFAVVSGREQQQGPEFDAATPIFYGTTYALTAGVFVTAAHVYRDAATDGRVALMRVSPSRVALVADVELFDEQDLALMVAPALADAAVLPYYFEPLYWWTRVRAIGFPFSVDPERLVLEMRAFEGHVVNRRELYQLPGQPPGYEVSFLAPPGLSGAPLLTEVDGTTAICGMILQQATNETAGVVTSLGIALDISELLCLDSRLLGGSIAQVAFGRPKSPPRQRTPVRASAPSPQ